MGVDCGFDMVPRLTESENDKRRWLAFIDDVKKMYKDDSVFEVQSNVITFKVGEYPRLPVEGHKFLRFSSKVSGSCSGAEPYIYQVCRIARKFVGQQVQFWHECADDMGYYDWGLVNESFRSYNEPSSDASTVQIPQVSGTVTTQKSVEDPGSAETTTILPLYTLTSLPGKGQGLVAAQAIPKGSRILSEKPLFTVPNRGYDEDSMNRLIADKLKLLSKDDQRAFFALHNNWQGRFGPFVGISKTNILPLGSDATEGGLFLQASRINHACLPNCQNTWNENIGEETIHNVRDIAKGEEITISYADTSTSKQRRAHLQSAFGFECTCSLCSLPLAELKASDNRLAEIEQLDNAIGDGLHLMQYPQQHLEMVHSLVRLLEAEKISDARLPRAYYDAFQTVVAHGDLARAKVFAERAYAARVCCEGEDSSSTMHMKELVANPKSHRLYGTSKKWSQDLKRTPKGLGAEEFEKWLWR